MYNPHVNYKNQIQLFDIDDCAFTRPYVCSYFIKDNSIVTLNSNDFNNTPLNLSNPVELDSNGFNNTILNLSETHESFLNLSKPHDYIFNISEQSSFIKFKNNFVETRLLTSKIQNSASEPT